MLNNITSLQYDSSKQSLRNKFIKIELLNLNFFTIDSLEGNVIDGKIEINSQSDLRRSCSISLVVGDSSFDVEAGGRIWLERYIRISVGIQNQITSEIVWNNMGIFLINKPSYNYDSSTNKMSFEGLDLMSKMTGVRNGYIMGIGNDSYTLIPQGSNVRDVIISILQKNNFRRYSVNECKNIDGVIQEVPYDIKLNQGSTWYDALKQLKDILPNYQMYFDVNGVFIYEKIPYSENDPIMIDDDIWNDNVISESISVDFENVKNYVEIYGRVHETDHFSDAETTIINDNGIEVSWTGVEELTEFNLYAFSLIADVTTISPIFISFLGNHNLVNYSNEYIYELEKDKYYVISYQSNGTFLFLGENQAYGVWEDNNPESPFYTGGEIGKIGIALYGEDYSNIISDDLALQRAKYEIYKRCRLNDSISLTSIPIYWIDVNWKVNYTKKDTNKNETYIIESVSISLSDNGTSNIKMNKFYPFYPLI